MPEDKDEFGVPIRKASPTVKETDEFGVPIKKKGNSVPDVKSGSTKSESGSDFSLPSLPKPNLGLQTKKPKGIGSSFNQFGEETTDFHANITNKALPSQKALQANIEIYDEVNGDGVANKAVNYSANKPEETVKTKVANKGNRGAYVYNQLLNGVGSLANGLVDVAAQSFKYNPTMGGMVNETTIKAYRENIAPQVRDYLKNQIGANVDRGAEATYNDEFITSSIGGLANSAPAMLTGMPGMVLLGYDAGLRAVQNGDPDGKLDETTKTIYAGGLGLVLGSLEKIGLDKVMKGNTSILGSIILSKSIKEAARKTGGKISGDLLETYIDQNIKGFAAKFLKGGARATEAFLAEFGTGSAQEVATIASEDLLNRSTGESIFDTSKEGTWDGFIKRVSYAGAQEGVGGLGMFGISQAGKAGLMILDSRRKKVIVDNQTKINEIDDHLTKDNITDEAKELLVKSKIELQDAVEKETDAEVQLQENLSPDGLKKAVEINEDLNKAVIALSDPTLSKTMKPEIEKQVKTLTEELDTIVAESKNDKEAETVKADPKETARKELIQKGIDFAFDKPKRMEFPDGEKGDLEYADANIQHNQDVDDTIAGITENGILTDSEGNKYSVRVGRNGSYVVEIGSDNHVYKNGRRVSKDAPFTKGFRFKPETTKVETKQPDINLAEQTPTNDELDFFENEYLDEETKPEVTTTTSEPKKGTQEYIDKTTAENEVLESRLKEIKEGKTTTFTYEKESDIPEILKDRVSSKGETNGKKIFRVTVSNSEAESLLKTSNETTEPAKTETAVPTKQPEPKTEAKPLVAEKEVNTFDANSFDLDKPISSREYKKGVKEEVESIKTEVKSGYKSELKWTEKNGNRWVINKTAYDVKDADLIDELELALESRNRGAIDKLKLDKYWEDEIVPKYGDIEYNKLSQKAYDASKSKTLNKKAEDSNNVLIDYLKARLAETENKPSAKKITLGRSNVPYTEVGKNSDGEAIYENADGIRAKESAPGIFSQETVSVIPTRQGVQVGKKVREDDFKTTTELEKVVSSKPTISEIAKESPNVLVVSPKGPKVIINTVSTNTESKPVSATKNKLADLDVEINDALKDFAKSLGKTLGSNGLSAESIEKGAKLVSLYTQRGIYKFADIIDDAYARFGEQIKELIVGLKAAYAAHNSQTTDEIADLMDDSKSLRAFDIEKHLGSKKEAVAEPEKNVRSFVDFVKETLLQGDRLNIVSLRRKATELGLSIPDTTIQEYAEHAIVEKAREIALQDDISEEAKLKWINQVYSQQPTITQRSSERISKQQYSTPVPMSFIGGLFANSINPKTVFEPSAGNGMLTIAFNQAKVWANEIDKVRLSVLSGQGFSKVTDQDATKPFGGKRNQDAVISNPPFGSAPVKNYDGYKVGGLDEQMIINALEEMKDNGRAVFIMGGHNSYTDKGSLKSERIFFNYLYNHYNVADVINMSGSLYQRQGTTFPTRMILIDGRKATPSGMAPFFNAEKNAPVENFTDLYERVQKNIRERENENKNLLQSTDDANGKNGLIADGRDSGTGENNINGTTGTVSETKVDTNITGSEGQQRKSTTSDTRSVESDGLRNQPGNNSGRTTSNGQLSALPSDSKPTDKGNQKTETGNKSTGSTTSVQRTDIVQPARESASDLVEKDKVPYRSKSKGNAIGSVIPSNMASETGRVLDNIENRHGDIDVFVKNKLGYRTVDEVYNSFSSEQIDAIAMAIDQIEQGKSLIVGDMTGVGKGRVAAGILRYAIHSGNRAIFLTEKPTLFSDLYRDMVDIGSSQYIPFVVNDKSSDSDPTITDAQGNVVHKPMPKDKKTAIYESGEIPEGHDFVMATYSQFTKKIDTDKKGYFKAVAAGSILIMDESHNVSGMSNSGLFFQEVLETVKGVTYLSATFAKRPDNMPVYALKTSMKDANMTTEELVEAITRGGVALQEIVSSDLVEAGQMVRRERDFTDVVNEFDDLEHLAESHKQTADEVTSIVRDIIDFQRTHVDEMIGHMDKEAKERAKDGEVSVSDFGKRKGTKDAGVGNTPFASRVFNVIDQMLFSIKAESVADEAIVQLKAGRKPVIAFKSTMESFFTNAGYQDGDTLTDHSFALSLLRALKGVMTYTETTAMGEPIKGQFSINDLTPQGKEAYRDIEQKIHSASANISISPIDIIIKKISDAGYKVGEITGRKLQLEFKPDGTALVKRREDRDIKKNVRNFNNGEGVDVILLNASGSTGLSMHASSKFKDQRQRVLITHQLELDINKEIQKRGRIDRSGQVLRGLYKYMVSKIPAESRLLMMFRSKLKSLDANSTSSQKSKAAMEVTDFLNKYGDKIVFDYLKENREMNHDLLDPFDFGAKTEEEINDSKPDEGAAQKATGKVAILPTEKQEIFYNEVMSRYADMLQYLEDNNLNDLEVKSVPLDAENIETSVYKVGKGGTSPFGRDSLLEKVTANVLKKPYSVEELEKEISTNLEGKTPAEKQKGLLSDIESYYKKAQVDAENSITKKYDDRRVLAKSKYEGKPQELAIALNNIDELQVAELNGKKESFTRNQNNVSNVFDAFRVGMEYQVPNSISTDNTTYSRGIFLGFEIKENAKNPFTPSNIRMRFATLDGRRVVSAPLSQGDFVNAAIAGKYQRAGLYGQAPLRENWGSLRSDSSRQTRYIITGNILQAYDGKGQLVAYTTKDGQLRKGILLPENFKGTNVGVTVPIARAMDSFNELKGGESLEATSDSVLITKMHQRGRFEISVPSSKARGGKYFLDENLRALVSDQNFTTSGSKMVARFDEADLDGVLQLLQTKFNLSVKLERFEDKKATEVDEHANIKGALDFLDRSKIKPGQTFGLLFPVPPPIWNGAVDVAKAVLKAGNSTQKAIVDAIAAGAQEIKKRGGTQQMADEFIRYFNEKLNSKAVEKKEPEPAPTEPTPIPEPETTAPDIDLSENPQPINIADDSNEIGITKKEAQRIRDEVGEEQYTYEVRKRAQVIQEAKELLASGFDVPGLINRIEKGDAAKNDVEVQLIREYFASITAKIATEPTNELLAERKRIMEILDEYKTRAGRIVQMFDGLMAAEDNLANFLQEEMDATGEALTGEEIEKLTKSYKKNQETQKKIKEQQENQSKKKAQDELDKIVKTKGTVKTHEDYAAERKSIRESIKAKWKKNNRQITGTYIPYFNHIVDIAPDVMRLVKSYVDENITNLDEIVRRAHSEVQDITDGEITENDIMDIIAGKYNEPRKTKSALAQQVRDLVAEAKLLQQLEDIANGVQPTEPKAKQRRSELIERLQAQVKELRKQTFPELAEDRTIKARRTRLTNAIAKLKADLLNGNWEKEPEPKLVKAIDPETQALIDEHVAFLNETHLRREKARHARRSKSEKAWDLFWQALAVRRIMQVAIDVSVPARQAAPVTFNARYWGIGLKNVKSIEGLLNTPNDIKKSINVDNFKNMFRSAFSAEYYDRLSYMIHTSPLYKNMIKDGVKFNETRSTQDAQRNEEHRHNFLYNAKGLGAVLKASNRVADSYLNSARFHLYTQGVMTLERENPTYTRENNPKAYQGIADWTMNLTGSGRMADFLEHKQPQRLLGNTFFGAKLMTSRLNLLNPVYYAKMDKAVQKQVMKDLIGYTTTATLVGFGLVAAGATVSFDWDDPDFMKARWGDSTKRYDIVTGGLGVYVRMALKVMASISNIVNPNKEINETQKSSEKTSDALFRSLRYKLSPNTSYMVDFYYQKTAIGQPFDWRVIYHAWPMYFDAMAEAYEEETVFSLITTVFAPSLWFGMSNYEEKDKKDNKYKLTPAQQQQVDRLKKQSKEMMERMKK